MSLKLDKKPKAQTKFMTPEILKKTLRDIIDSAFTNF